MPAMRHTMGPWVTCLTIAALTGCAGQMPTVAGFMRSPSLTMSLSGWTPQKVTQEQHPFDGPYRAEDDGFGTAIGLGFGNRWRGGLQLAVPFSATLEGGFLGDHFGSMNWLGTSLSGVSLGTASIEQVNAGDWFRLGIFQYCARNEMPGRYSSAPMDFFPKPITDGSAAFFEVGTGAVVAMRKGFWDVSPLSLEAKVGRDLTFARTRFYLTVSMSQVKL